MKIRGHNFFRASVLLIALFTSPLTLADRSDWVQVERFEKQLVQAQLGKVTAMYDVGRMYERGRGTGYDPVKAAEWYEKAASAGSAPAMARLGVMYMEGRGVNQEHKKAYRLFAEAANDGVPLAQYNLGLMYEWGTVVKQDRHKAIFWYQKALKGGDYRASNKIKQLKSQAPGTAISIAPAPAPVKAASPEITGKATIEAVLTTKWRQGTHPAGYLPSSISHCEKISAVKIKCVTNKQQRNTDTETIIYDTEATLENFKGNHFTITYTNTVVEVIPREAIIDPLDEDDIASATSDIKVGQKSRPHELECQLLNRSSLHCTKNNIHTYNFTS